MKKSISCDIVHLSGCDCFCVGICILLRDEEKEITVGFVYVGDASTAYTAILLMRRRQSRQNTGIR